MSKHKSGEDKLQTLCYCATNAFAIQTNGLNYCTHMWSIGVCNPRDQQHPTTGLVECSTFVEKRGTILGSKLGPCIQQLNWAAGLDIAVKLGC